ncbi:hypothetical protein SAMN04487897_13124 [Paenibacillus sp. yr247]|uniref:hypothetical protein n=1 Tax=Paenibacillus sp. yr247 TaxID=1761880 RepID=UPI00088F981A|nr:hypothetical protein [Paenibacillus sp. yr247]SDP02249.1 hypothetical protein SAMN04487897_13124 [Paenibacillus sp. yr247]
MKKILELPYHLEILDQRISFPTYQAATQHLDLLKGDGPCVFHAIIRNKGNIVLESIPLIIDGKPVF